MSMRHKQKRDLRAEAASHWSGQRLPEGGGLCPLPDPTHCTGPRNSLKAFERDYVSISQEPSCRWGLLEWVTGWRHCIPTVAQEKGSPWQPPALRSIWSPLSNPDPRATTQHYLTLRVWTPAMLPALLLARFSRARCSRDIGLLSLGRAPTIHL